MRVENPLSGWPPTRPLRRGDGYRVKARYFTPEGAKWTDLLAFLVNAGVLAIAVWAWLNGAFMTEATLYTAAGIVLVVWIVVWAARFWWARPLFGKTARVEVKPDVIRIGRVMGYRNYDRNVPHAFEYAIHDKAQAEADMAARIQQNAAAKKQEAATVGKYYRDSWHVILRYAGQRIDIASVYGKQKAEALLARLHLLDALMDAAAGDMTGHARPEPARQYGERPEAG